MGCDSQFDGYYSDVPSVSEKCKLCKGKHLNPGTDWEDCVKQLTKRIATLEKRVTEGESK